MSKTSVADASSSDRGNKVDSRTRRLIEAPILPLLLRLAWPNVLIMLAQASTGLIETWWVSKLGNDALAGMALVFPAVMLMTTISAGGIGGGIASAIARTLGAGKRDEADGLVLHAIVINIVLALAFSALFIVFGRQIYTFMGGSGGALEAALIYSNIVFAGNVFSWLMNGLASIVRGAGNMFFPAVVTCVGILFLIPISPVLIFGVGSWQGLGVVGGGVALVTYYAVGSLVIGWYVVSGRNPARFRWVKLRWPPLAAMLRIGALSSIQSIQTNLIVAGATTLVGATAGVNAVAGFGTGVRLEYLLIPLIFGIGAPMVALVGTNIGAGRKDRALKIAMIGAGLAFLITETIGVAAALFPTVWLDLFSAEPATVAEGSAYLQIVGPFYGFFGIGLALYFASQGAGRLLGPLIAGTLRVMIALGGGWLALKLTGSLTALYIALAVGLIVYGLAVLMVVRGRSWLR